MLQAVTSIVHLTVLEGLRTRLLFIVVALLAAIAVAAEFSASLAITDSQSYRTGVYAALSRLVIVLLTILFVTTSIARELQDRALDLTWSRPVSRASWYVSRLLGFCLIAATLAMLATVPLVVIAAPYQALVWGVSLVAETALMACAALTFVVTLRQVPLAVTATSAFYFLGRAMDAIVLMSHGPTVDPSALPAPVIASTVEVIALLIPALGRFGQSEWLEVGAVAVDLGPLLIETLVYSALLVAVGLFDTYRIER